MIQNNAAPRPTRPSGQPAPEANQAIIRALREKPSSLQARCGTTWPMDGLRRPEDALMETSGRTTFVITQRLSTVQQANQILVIEAGRSAICCAGTSRHPLQAAKPG